MSIQGLKDINTAMTMQERKGPKAASRRGGNLNAGIGCRYVNSGHELYAYNNERAFRQLLKLCHIKVPKAESMQGRGKRRG